MIARPIPLLAAFLVLVAAWVWPIPAWDEHPFGAHMAAHSAVVAIAAPLFALAIAGGPLDPVRWRNPPSALAASLVEGVVVWAWHAPALHVAARNVPAMWVLEQASFLVCAIALWVAALGGGEELRRGRAIAGTAALLLTSMHMTLLGALIGLAPRPLYVHAHGDGAVPGTIDQHIGGGIMAIVGGLAYLGGGLALIGDLVRTPRESARTGQT